MTLSYGSELIGMQRDWNEELQSCREFPHTSPQERCVLFSILLATVMHIVSPIHLLLIFLALQFFWSISAVKFISPVASNCYLKLFSNRILRDRALYKVTSDFVDAAISGAIGVISRCIPPINPTDPECFHMLVEPKMNSVTFSIHCDIS